MRTVVLTGFDNLNKVKLDKGFKAILSLDLKQSMVLTEELLSNKRLEIIDLSGHQVELFLALAKDANAKIDIV